MADTSKELSFVINAYDTKVKSLSYEIRTSDGSKVLENRKIKSLDKQDSYLTTTIKLSSDLLMNQEYSFCNYLLRQIREQLITIQE